MSKPKITVNASPRGCFGCLGTILAVSFIALFFLGACAADPEGSGFEHDLEQGLAAMIRPVRAAWEGTSQ